MENTNRERQSVTFDIMQHIGVLGKSGSGWTKEINIVSWNGGRPKFDIREWDPEHERMSRGITLTENEMRGIIESIREKMPEIRSVMDRSAAQRDKGTER